MKLEENSAMIALERIFVRKGIAKGREEIRIENASKALERGLDLDMVADITGLSLEAVEELAASKSC